MKEIQMGFDYDDVLIVPGVSSVASRRDVDISTVELTNGLKFKTPFVAANMSTICEAEMAETMGMVGGLGVIHRFCTPENQADMLNSLVLDDDPAAVAVGVGEDEVYRASILYKKMSKLNLTHKIFVVDIAHGHSKNCVEMIEILRESYADDIIIVAGNIVTPPAAHALVSAGADMLKVGIGSGSNCITRQVTGVGFPQLTSIMMIREMLDLQVQAGHLSKHVPIIADGGIKTSGDAAKAIAGGADLVMIGSLLAGTDEAPAKLTTDPSGYKVVKEYSGMASFHALKQKKELLGDNSPIEKYRSEEGITTYVDHKGSAVDVIEKLNAGLRSAYSYVGAFDTRQFKMGAQFVGVTR